MATIVNNLTVLAISAAKDVRRFAPTGVGTMQGIYLYIFCILYKNAIPLNLRTRI
ncbi:hypothetical protein L3556_13090 [Candidatus Synechococcus calcipolaris G9]|uniref:Uncharacterized protein n=1 Tax=Candidatus Synechococcus calcipolaris G9 TaxID=1497997 RepID=A0ABT6F1X4_9SYNE|nr:hypothetical protein [Candidatus Synechococcus calcipolaris]MDG2991857.1 hypothetical protein [Candidatus Synechococcus calcipolaris G9]